MIALRTAFKSYQKCLQKYPLSTQSVQAGTLMGVGDLIAQTFVEKNSLSNVNLLRTARFACIGLCIAGPCLRTWYLFLDRRVGHKSNKAALKKVLLDQFLFAPIFLGALLTSINLAESLSINHVKEKMIADYPDVLITNYYVWPLVQVFNFSLIPLNYQVLVVQIVAIFWNTYLSWKANLPLDRPAVERDEVLLKKIDPSIGV